MPPIRVLQVVPAMDMGGMETFIMNIYRHIDRQRVQFDFLYHYTRPCHYDGEIEAMGGRIYKLSVREDNNLPKYLRGLNAFFSQHPEYAVIHGHYSGFGMFYNWAAKKHGVAQRAGHSHSTGSERSLTGLLDKGMSRFFRYGITKAFACGQEAGLALYGKRPFTVIPNGVDVGRFAWDAKAAERVRAAQGLAGAVVYGHVGRFSQPKNHRFLLEVFGAIAARQQAARLLLVGEGPLRAAVQRQAAALGLVDRVVFAGLQDDMPAWYSAMDALIFPSLYEGVSLTLVEAQANGLPCFVSDAVAPENDLSCGYRTLPLAGGPAAWADAILAAPPARLQDVRRLRDAGYDIRHSAALLQQWYLEAAGQGA